MDGALAVLQKRATLSLLYSVVCQAVLVLLFTSLCIDVLHPVSWVNNTVSKATSFYTWSYFCVLCLMLIALSGVMKMGLFEDPKCYGSRFSVLKNLLTPKSVMSMGLYALVSTLTVCTYLSVIGGDYSYLIQPCAHSSGNCVVESHVYLLFCGMWSGVYFSLYNSLWRPYTPMFPIIQQLKFLRLKAEFIPSLKKAGHKAIVPILLCPLLYSWKGNNLLYILCDIFDSTVEGKLFEFITDYLNFRLLFLSWLLTAIFMFTVFVMEHILQILLTEMCAFPITTRFGDKKTCVLSDVISCNKYLLIQNLGCFDLLNVAKNDKTRRQEIFALSQPGGHPTSWTAIRVACLNLINNFCNEINRASLETSLSNISKSSNVVSTPAQSSSHRPREAMSPGVLRNLSLGGFEGTSFPYEHQLQDNPPVVMWGQMLKSILSSIKCHVVLLFRRTGLHYIFEKTPDAKLKFVFLKSLCVNNAIQALSFLVTASFTEDSYGVVQKDLDSILSAILLLKHTLDKLPKGGNFKRALKNEPYDVQMKAVLKATVKRSLYSICIVFGNHFHEMNFKEPLSHCLQAYLSFRD